MAFLGYRHKGLKHRDFSLAHRAGFEPTTPRFVDLGLTKIVKSGIN